MKKCTKIIHISYPNVYRKNQDCNPNKKNIQKLFLWFSLFSTLGKNLRLGNLSKVVHFLFFYCMRNYGEGVEIEKTKKQSERDCKRVRGRDRTKN